jgi:hypothetical protein
VYIPPINLRGMRILRVDDSFMATSLDLDGVLFPCESSPHDELESVISKLIPDSYCRVIYFTAR